jgi:hypothetical protein
VALHVRVAGHDDLGAITELTRKLRHRLADWSPAWWRMREGADELHPRWLQHVVGTGAFRVVVDDTTVVACAAVVAPLGDWCLDDVAIDDDARWPAVAGALFAAVTERPALTCLATADVVRADAFLAAGTTPASTYWIGRPVAGTYTPGPSIAAVAPAPPHTFGPGFDPSGPASLFVGSGGGYAIGSPSVPAPPVYDPGGTVAIVDRVVGDDLGAVIRAASAAAAARGDVRLNVVCGAGDDRLAEALAVTGLERTVEVHRLG